MNSTPAATSVRTKKLKRVLVIEDDAIIRSLIVQAVDEEGLESFGAIDGLHAVNILKALPVEGLPDCIVLDLMMPRMNGWEFLVNLRTTPELSKIPVLILSALADREKLPGVSGSINKPFDIDALLNLIKSIIEKAKAR